MGVFIGHGDIRKNIPLNALFVPQIFSRLSTYLNEVDRMVSILSAK